MVKKIDNGPQSFECIPQLIQLNFTNSATTAGTGAFSSFASAEIRIPDLVKEIIVRQISWVDNGTATPSYLDIGFLYSTQLMGSVGVNPGFIGATQNNQGGNALIGGATQGVVFQPGHVPVYQTLVRTFKTPISVNGIYNFFLKDIGGNAMIANSRTQCLCAVTLEFITIKGAYEL